MKQQTSIFAILGCALLVGAVACGDSSGTGGTGGSGATSAGGDPNTGGTPSTGGEGGTGGTSTGFVFATDPYEDYAQIDRHAAVEAGTVGIKATSGLGLNGEDIAIRDDYNASNPVDDADGMWLGEISDSVTDLHGALDDDLIGLGLEPATVAEALAQAGPVLVPDTIKYDPSQPTSYPNGRNLEDQVVDITLAAALLKLGVDQPLTTFADIPVNPGANDVPFKASFPYLADPH